MPLETRRYYNFKLKRNYPSCAFICNPNKLLSSKIYESNLFLLYERLNERSIARDVNQSMGNLNTKITAQTGSRYVNPFAGNKLLKIPCVREPRARAQAVGLWPQAGSAEGPYREPVGPCGPCDEYSIINS